MKDKLTEWELATDINFSIAIEDAVHSKPPLQKNPFQTIGDRSRLIKHLRKNGFDIIKTHKP